MLKYKVVKSQRGLNGKWFSYPPSMISNNRIKAETYALCLCAAQRASGVVGTRINILTRDGTNVAEFKV